MICKEIEGVLAMFTLATGVTGLGEPQSKKSDWDLDDLSDRVQRASVRDVRLGPMLIVHDGVDVANMGRPFASLPVIRCLSLPINRVPLGLAWGSGETPACSGALVPVLVVWWWLIMW
jgi:hypothetical protein